MLKVLNKTWFYYNGGFGGGGRCLVVVLPAGKHEKQVGDWMRPEPLYAKRRTLWTPGAWDRCRVKKQKKKKKLLSVSLHKHLHCLANAGVLWYYMFTLQGGQSCMCIQAKETNTWIVSEGVCSAFQLQQLDLAFDDGKEGTADTWNYWSEKNVG